MYPVNEPDATVGMFFQICRNVPGWIHLASKILMSLCAHANGDSRLWMGQVYVPAMPAAQHVERLGKPNLHF